MKNFLKRNILIISIILFLGICLLNINTAPLWRDEAFSALVATNDWGKIIQIAAKDTQPPLHLFLLHISYLITGKGEFALRIWSVLGGILTIVFALKITSKITKDDWSKVLVAPLIIFNPVLYNYALEARPYALFTALYLGAIYYSLRYNTSKKKRDLIMIFIISLLGLYIHNLFVVCLVTIFALLFYLSYRETKKWKNIKDILVLGILIVIAYLPWLLTFLSQLSMVSSGGFWLQFNYLNSVQEVLAMSYAGEYYYQQNDPIFFILLISVVLGILGILISWGKDLFKIKTRLPFFLITSFLPLFLSYLLSFKTPFMYVRYMIFLIPIFLISIVKIFEKKRILIIFFLISSMCVTSATLIFKPNLKENYKGAIAAIQYESKTDVVFHKNALPVFGFRYYSNMPSYIYSKPEDIRYYEGKAELEPADYWQGDINEVGRIWVLNIWQDDGFDKKITDLGFVKISTQKFDGDLYLSLFTRQN